VCVRFDVISVFVTDFDLVDQILLNNPDDFSDQSVRIRPQLESLRYTYEKMLDQFLSKSKDLGDTLRFLPGVVVQKEMSMRGMADLYRIKPGLLERLVKSPNGFLRLGPLDFGQSARRKPGYTLDGYLSGFLQDKDRSQLYYCDPKQQHIFLCRHFLSLQDESNAFDLQS
jgi:hypothetical protein